MDLSYIDDAAGGNSTSLYYLYDSNGDVVGLQYNNEPYYFQKNVQGDVIRIVNSAGTVVVEYAYDAWGNILSVTGTLADTIGQYNPFRYRSYYYDAETGLYYLQSRYYDPAVGRFINADGIVGANGGIQGYNMFAYCNNNPVMYDDPSGEIAEESKIHSSREALGLACGLALAAGLNAIISACRSTTITISYPKSLIWEERAKVQEAEKEAIKDVVVSAPQTFTTIYRYGYAEEGVNKLVPTDLDEKYDSGLSFSTKYRKGSFVTTIEAINSTGILVAIKDGEYHVSVYPLWGTVGLWRLFGANSIWTQTLLLVGHGNSADPFSEPFSIED